MKNYNPSKRAGERQLAREIIEARHCFYTSVCNCLQTAPAGSRGKAERRKLINIFIENAPTGFPELDEDELKDIKWSLIQKFCL